MLDRLKQHWHNFRRPRPGARFRVHYREQAHARSSPLRRYAGAGSGAVLMLAGIALLPAPGPGTLVMIAGAVLLARGSWRAARTFDRVDLGVHRLRRLGVAKWHAGSVPVRSVLVLGGLVGAAAAGLGAYRLLF